MALGINSPWYIKEVTLDKESNHLTLFIDFEIGSKFNCPTCDELCPVYDTKQKRWQHLNFWQYCCYLTARVPRVHCTKCNKTLQVQAPFAREGSGFSLLLECMMLEFAKIMPVSEVAKMFAIGDDRVWTVIHHYIPPAVMAKDWSMVSNIGIDETSHKKGHKYITTVTDLDTSTVLFITDGKDKSTVEDFRNALESRKLNVNQIQNIASDLSPAFILGIKNNFPEANHVFDKFHVVKIVNKAVDDVRKREEKSNERVRKCKYSLLKNRENLTANQEIKLQDILAEYTLSGEAYNFKLGFQALFTMPSKEEAKSYLDDWISSVKQSGILEMQKLAKSIKRHSDRILNWFDKKISNGKVEALNCGIQNLKRRAKGFRTLANFKALVYLVMGKLSF